MSESRRLEDLVWVEVQAAIEAARPVIVPIGATEQHGPHLPSSTDTVIVSELADAIAPVFGALVAPATSYGYRSRPLSGGGEGFASTVSLSGATLTALVGDIVSQLLRHGFQTVVLLNWHFENAPFLYEAAVLASERSSGAPHRIIVHEAPGLELSETLLAEMYPAGFPGWQVEHAGLYETALMLHLRPAQVQMDAAVDDRSERRPAYEIVPPPSDLISASGVLSNPTGATAELGRRVWEELVETVIAELAADLPRVAAD